jgi:hypothetical protein
MKAALAWKNCTPALKNYLPLLAEAPHVAKDKKKRKPHNSNGYSQQKFN